MGPTGSISGPAVSSPSDSIGPDDPRRDFGHCRPARSTRRLTVPSFDGTFKVARLTVQLNVDLSERFKSHAPL